MPAVLRTNPGNSPTDQPLQGFKCDSAEGQKATSDDRHKLREFGNGGGKAKKLDNS